jgi:hypothetical protein
MDLLIIASQGIDASEAFNSPGLVGFLATFGVASLATLLFFDMNRRIRKSKYRSEIRQRLAEEDLDAFDKNAKPDRPEPPAPPTRD